MRLTCILSSGRSLMLALAALFLLNGGCLAISCEERGNCPPPPTNPVVDLAGTTTGGSPDLRAPAATCNGQEVDLQSDHNHCGNCTTQCSDVQGCIRGICKLVIDECTTTKACTEGKTCKQGEFAKYCQFVCQGHNLKLKNGQEVGTFGNDPCGAGGMGGGGINCLVRSCKSGQAIGPQGQEDTNDCQSATAKREGDGVMYCQ